ncbi:MAG: hypothetical protein J3Q66DRAFT_337019 [Benniella sp.]|nr:MAG: hypothetical protein J3Q66DRAFT_362107 [Benniella sp.]KAK3820390.1 MAG: hypothetical protein J3Q66DRAFT_337019 [Benniella sp.]
MLTSLWCTQQRRQHSFHSVLVLPLLIARLIVATLTHPLAHYRHTHCSHHTFKRERHCQCMFVQLSFGSCLAC